MIVLDTDQRVRRRMRRTLVFLGAAGFVHGTTLVTTALIDVTGGVRPFTSALAVAVLVLAPLAALVRWERTAPSAHRPAAWLRRAAGVALPHHIGCALAATAHWDLPAPPVVRWVVFGGIPLVAELAAVALAGRALSKPFTSELGGMDVDVVAKIRSSTPSVPAFLSHDDVILTGTRLVVTVRPNATWKHVESIPLADILEVDDRPGNTGEPWFAVEDERVYPTPPGDVVRVVHRSGVRSLPVEDPSGFANVLRARIENAREYAAKD